MFATEIIRHPDGRTSKVFRAGQGPLVVWLHGPHGIRSRDPVIAELAKRHTVVAPLAPGFADLAELDEIRNVHELALHYDDVLQALGLEAVTLIGHSFGAMVAAEVAAHFPRRVARLVLISPIGLWQDQHPLPDMFGQVPYMTIDTLLWKAGKAIPAMADPADEPNNPVERQVAIAQALTSVAKFVWPLPDRGTAPAPAAHHRADPADRRRGRSVCARELCRGIRVPYPRRQHGNHTRRRPYGAVRAARRGVRQARRMGRC